MRFSYLLNVSPYTRFVSSYVAHKKKSKYRYKIGVDKIYLFMHRLLSYLIICADKGVKDRLSHPV